MFQINWTELVSRYHASLCHTFLRTGVAHECDWRSKNPGLRSQIHQSYSDHLKLKYVRNRNMIWRACCSKKNANTKKGTYLKTALNTVSFGRVRSRHYFAIRWPTRRSDGIFGGQKVCHSCSKNKKEKTTINLISVEYGHSNHMGLR